MSNRSVATTTTSKLSNSALIRKRIAQKRRLHKLASTRKQIFSSGWKSNVLTTICLVAALLLCFAHFEHLQSDADYKLFELDYLLTEIHKKLVQEVIRYGHSISAFMFLLHIVAIKFSKARFTFSELLALFAWPALVFLHYEQNHHRDYLICRLALSIFTMLVTTAIIFLPKKLKRKKKADTFYSAFSIASTPTSQRSSEFNQSHCTYNTNLSFDGTRKYAPTLRMMDFEDDGTSIFSNARVPSAYRNIKNRISHGRGKGTTFEEVPNVSNHGVFDAISLRSGKTIEKRSSPYASSRASVSTTTETLNSLGWREKRRELTPMCEVRQLIDDLLINSTDDDDDGNDSSVDEEVQQIERSEERNNRTSAFQMPTQMLTPGALSPNRQRRPNQQGPFASLTYNPAVRKKAATGTGLSPAGLFAPKNSVTLSYGGSSCSSLSNSNVNSSPFRHL